MSTQNPAGLERAHDQRLMAAAIRLSTRHLGLTGENPSVGSLVVRYKPDGDPVIVGRGVTAVGGRPHAELQALSQAGELARGATAFATLEPCSHIGKAPPCADALVSSGIARVVIATLDPDIRVAGRGVAILERAGIEVTVGTEGAEARRAMEGFLSLRGRGRPFVTLKLAVSADGFIGRPGDGQVAITGRHARQAVQCMRLVHEAVMVGVGTVIEDDPKLTLRLPGLSRRSPLRIIVDPFARTPAGAAMFDERDSGRILVLTSEKAPRHAVDALRSAGVTIHVLPSDYKGRFEPREILRSLGLLGVKSILLEGGAETARRFLASGLVDRIALFTATREIGPRGIASPVREDHIPAGFTKGWHGLFGDDRMIEFERQD